MVGVGKKKTVVTERLITPTVQLSYDWSREIKEYATENDAVSENKKTEPESCRTNVKKRNEATVVLGVTSTSYEARKP
jgi:hypothetical protein